MLTTSAQGAAEIGAVSTLAAVSDTELKVLVAFAAVAVALATIIFGFLNEWNQNRLRRKGISRVLKEDLRRAQSMLVRAWIRQAWWLPNEQLEGRLSLQDQQRLATSARPNEWATISSALGWLNLLQRAATPAAIDAENREHSNGKRSAAPSPTAGGQPADLPQQMPELIADCYERLDAARWSLCRLAAPIPARVPVPGITRVRWRKHGVNAIANQEIKRAEKRGDPEAEKRGRRLLANRTKMEWEPGKDIPDLSKRQLRRRRYRGVTEARAWEARVDKGGRCEEGFWEKTRADLLRKAMKSESLVVPDISSALAEDEQERDERAISSGTEESVAKRPGLSWQWRMCRAAAERLFF